MYRSDVGDKNVVDMMEKHGLNFGGESSGHIIFGDFAKTGDGILTALQTISCVIQSGKVASEALNLFETYPQRSINLNIIKKKPFEEMDGFEELKSSLEEIGIKPLFRYSGTENKIRLLLQSKSDEVLEREMRRVMEFFMRELK
jgi:phosphoglucosamine mutase